MCTPPRNNQPTAEAPGLQDQTGPSWQDVSQKAANRLLSAATAEKTGEATGEATGADEKKSAQDAPWQTPWAGNPAINAISARFAYLGLKGDLLVTKTQALERLHNTGSLGTQLTERLRVMESQGWSIGPMSPNDDFMRRHFKNPFKRYLTYPMIAGHRSDFHGDVQVKRVGYNSTAHLMNQSITSFGSARDRKSVV